MGKEDMDDRELYQVELEEWQSSDERAELKDIILGSMRSHVKRKGMKKLIEDLEISGYFDAPASTRFHNASFGGLAKHSFDVTTRFLSVIMKDKLDFPKESVFICGLLHDLCKVNLYIPYFTQTGKRGKNAWKTEEILPIGHAEKSIVLIERFIDLTPKELLVIRWHMGSYDYSFKQYEDRATKLCPMIKIFSACDMISSVIELIRKDANGG